jgi:hypothetical protein
MKWILSTLMLVLIVAPVAALDITSAQSWIEEGELRTFVKIKNPSQDDITVSTYVFGDDFYQRREINSDDTTASAFFYGDIYAQDDLWVRISVVDEDGNKKTVHRPVIQ